jgi:hypothetical protein
VLTHTLERTTRVQTATLPQVKIVVSALIEPAKTRYLLMSDVVDNVLAIEASKRVGNTDCLHTVSQYPGRSRA